MSRRDIGGPTDDGVDLCADIYFADGQAVGVFVGVAGVDTANNDALETLAEGVHSFKF